MSSCVLSSHHSQHAFKLRCRIREISGEVLGEELLKTSVEVVAGCGQAVVLVRVNLERGKTI